MRNVVACENMSRASILRDCASTPDSFTLIDFKEGKILQGVLNPEMRGNEVQPRGFTQVVTTPLKTLFKTRVDRLQSYHFVRGYGTASYFGGGAPATAQSRAA
jgi:hypothetical protein